MPVTGAEGQPGRLADGRELLIAWWVTDRDPRKVESELLATFVTNFGRLPFANLVS